MLLNGPLTAPVCFESHSGRRDKSQVLNVRAKAQISAVCTMSDTPAAAPEAERYAGTRLLTFVDHCYGGADLQAVILELLPLLSFNVSCRKSATEIFVCDEESQFYSQCLEKLLVRNSSSSSQIVIEFGSGDGAPVIGCLMNSQFLGVVHGFELNSKAAALATFKAADMQLSNRYKVGSPDAYMHCITHFVQGNPLCHGALKQT